MSMMQKRLYLNLGLAALLIALLVVVIGLPQGTTTKAPLVTIPATDIQRIQITKPDDKDSILLLKQANIWYMQQPKQALVNPVRIAQLLTLTDEAIEADYDAQATDLSSFGLTPAHVSLQINEQRYDFGNLNPVSKQRYILTKGRLYLVSEGVDSLLTSKAFDWIDLQLVPENVPIKTVILPMGYRQIPELKQNWQSANAVRIEACTGQEPQQGSIKLILTNGQTLDYQWLKTHGEELILCNSTLGLRYILPNQQQTHLLPEANLHNEK